MYKIKWENLASYQLYLLLVRQLEDFFTTLGDISLKTIQTFRCILRFDVDRKEFLTQAARFGVSSLPITLSIVGMSAIIVSMQVAGEMIKQGAGNYVGMLVTMLIVRENGIIMSGFAIISMIGSSMASELATMRVTEQIDAIKVLKVDPIRYLFAPRVLAGLVTMPLLVTVASLFGIIGGAIASYAVGGLSFKAYFDSVWFGLNTHDILVCLAKSVFFGATIAIVSCTCGYKARGGAKGVGVATTKAVVWSFVAIVLWDLLFALAFFF